MLVELLGCGWSECFRGREQLLLDKWLSVVCLIQGTGTTATATATARDATGARVVAVIVIIIAITIIVVVLRLDPAVPRQFVIDLLWTVVQQQVVVIVVIIIYIECVYPLSLGHWLFVVAVVVVGRRRRGRLQRQQSVCGSCIVAVLGHLHLVRVVFHRLFVSAPDDGRH